MNSDAFKTSAGSMYKTNDIEKCVKIDRGMGANISWIDECPYAPNDQANNLVQMIIQGSACPPFRHPFLVVDSGNRDRATAIVDGRGFTRAGRDGDVTPSNKSEYLFNVGRAFLTAIAVNDSPTVLLNFSEVPAQAFARWLTDRINGQLHVELEDQLVIRACAAWFYVCQFFDEESFTKDEQNRCVARAARACGMDLRQWETIMGKDALPWTGTIDLFCALVKNQTDESIRVDGLDRRFVTEVTIGSWRGAQAREIVAVGLEHPPTWIAMIQMCVAESSYYKKMPLGETVERILKRRSDKDDFLLAVSRLPF